MQLKKLAANMRANARAFSTLPRGLSISWERDDEQVRLSVGRLAPTWPSDAEIAIIRNAFAVPDDVEASRRTVDHTSPKTGKITRYCTVTLTWRERQPIINR